MAVSGDLHLLQFLLLVREFNDFVSRSSSKLISLLTFSLFAFSTFASLAILALVSIFCTHAYTSSLQTLTAVTELGFHWRLSVSVFFTVINKNSSGDEIANVNFLRRYGTYVLKNTKKREPTSFNQLDDSSPSTAHSVLSL